MSVHPPQAKLIRQFEVHPFGAGVAKPADVNGDGKLELLLLQTPGQFKARQLYEGHLQRLGLDEADLELHCLTAWTLDGEKLWQHGRPWDRRDPFTGHGGGDLVRVDDINADGKAEVLCLRDRELLMLDGATGKELKSTTLPADNYVRLYTAQLSDPAEGRQILCRVNDRAYKPWEYANPTIILNADLSVRHEPFAVRGAGHNLVATDLDGDGRDELLIGYSLFDHDLRELWRLDLGEDFDYAGDHADEIALDTLPDTGKPCIRYAGSEDFFVVDLEGNVLWRTEAGHSQKSVSGPWGPDGEQRILMSEKNRGVWGLDAGGTVLWNRKDINGYAGPAVRWQREGPRETWCLFRPQLPPFHPTPYLSDPADSETLWPKFIEGDGTLLEALPWDPAYAQPARQIRAPRSYDCGVHYGVIVVDIDEDGLDELIVHDRRNIWLFHAP